MKIRLMFLVVLTVIAGCSDDKDIVTTPTSGIDTRGLDRYLSIAKRLSQNAEPNAAEWDSLFVTPYFDILINKQKLSTRSKEQEAIRLVYTKTNHSQAELDLYSHHFNYKAKLNELENYSKSLQRGAIVKTLRDYLWPFLPARLQQESLIPPIVYTFYIAEEANGLTDMILQDALLSYKIDNFANGILTAHEAFHSITTKSLEARTKIDLTEDAALAYLMSELTGIAQEGIADLIDKDVLSQPQSPVYDLVQLYIQDEDDNATTFIQNLNFEMEQLAEGIISEQPLQTSAFGGHQPGRYMGKAIQAAGELNALIPDVENPFAFFYAYQRAAEKLGSAYPKLSPTTLVVLTELEQQVLEPAK